MEENKIRTVSVRLVEGPPLYSPVPIRNPEDAARLIGERMAGYDRELVCLLNLQSDNQVINASILGIGTLNQALVSPRETFKASILSNAASVILLHNHPSGSCSPSRDDRLLAARIAACGRLLDIPLLDFIIVGPRDGYYSFQEAGLLPETGHEIELSCFTGIEPERRR